MTTRELSRLFHLKREIDLDEKRLGELRCRAGGSKTLPARAQSGDGKSESCAWEMAKLTATIEEKRSRCLRERGSLEQYIAEIDDSLTRQVFTLRFVNGYSWTRVTACVGGGNNEDGIKQMCYRQLKKMKNDNEQ